MENYYLERLRSNGAVDGNEAFGIPKFLTPIEGFRLRLSSLSLELDRKISGMSGSIHTVDYKRAQAKANKLSYLSKVDKQMGVPVHFNERTMTWDQYVKNCMAGVSLMDGFKTDSVKFYGWLKEIAAKGKVGTTYRHTISGTSQHINEIDKFIKSLGDPKRTQQVSLETLYPSFGSMFALINDFNLRVKMIKARDAEIIARQLKLNAELAEVVLSRILSSDIVLSEREINQFKETFDEFERYMNVTGATIGLLNELSAVFKGHCDAVQSW
ncbi:hypothetical protein FDJ25_gp196 [Vibrio phage Aphrodite1]|uniref:Uncharacterized protein n=1 Tax=Vibrio phage Aphrodite1 TaxID=2070057 RepID=A0A2I7QHX7_9CAUD|nr:hypothetical protein FDJ25_gp196 [Vibrio phage Aphrodite1]AUR81001.1 hypothetical protein Aphrodite1_0003 [Vibrio phage Aphrodite1]